MKEELTQPTNAPQYVQTVKYAIKPKYNSWNIKSFSTEMGTYGIQNVHLKGLRLFLEPSMITAFPNGQLRRSFFTQTEVSQNPNTNDKTFTTLNERVENLTAILSIKEKDISQHIAYQLQIERQHAAHIVEWRRMKKEMDKKTKDLEDNLAFLTLLEHDHTVQAEAEPQVLNLQKLLEEWREIEARCDVRRAQCINLVQQLTLPHFKELSFIVQKMADELTTDQWIKFDHHDIFNPMTGNIIPELKKSLPQTAIRLRLPRTIEPVKRSTKQLIK